MKLVEVGIPSAPENMVTETALLIFDSHIDGGPVPDEFQARDATSPPPRQLDFDNNAYYVELSLIAPERPLTNPPAVSPISDLRERPSIALGSPDEKPDRPTPSATRSNKSLSMLSVET